VSAKLWIFGPSVDAAVSALHWAVHTDAYADVVTTANKLAGVMRSGARWIGMPARAVLAVPSTQDVERLGRRLSDTHRLVAEIHLMLEPPPGTAESTPEKDPGAPHDQRT
jgi:hypothetical protein